MEDKKYIERPVLEILESRRPVLWNKRNSPVSLVRNVRIGKSFYCINTSLNRPCLCNTQLVSLVRRMFCCLMEV